MDYETAMIKLRGEVCSGVKLGLQNIKILMEKLGNPQDKLKVIHIAGTNGKGSCTSFVNSVLVSQGYKVGMFTSPSIYNFEERIRINNKNIPEDKLIELMNEVRNVANTLEVFPADFELITAVSLLYFYREKCDFAIMEVGLGGRLDATNILNSDIALITNISFDHTAILGNSLKEISYEKAGIIKNRELCIYADSLPELEEEINKKTENSINVIKKYSDMEVELDKINYKTVIKFQDKKFTLPLFGKFQANNFLLAYETSKFYNINDETIQKGISKVFWPARFEFFSTEPPVILDAAHNDDSIRKLAENLSEVYEKNEVIIITSLLETKDFEQVFTKLEKITDKIFITSLKDTVYGLTSSEIRERMLSLNIPINDIIFEDDIMTAYENALSIVKDENSGYKAIVICGSFYEIAKFNRIIAGK